MMNQSQEQLEQIKPAIEALITNFNSHILGQPDLIRCLLAGLITRGHILIEGVPGLGKTWAVRLLSRLIHVDFKRIQFTPDLMPSDVLGTSVYYGGTGKFEFRPGPVFSNLILIDEINRAPAKTQSALFEVMEERQVTVDGITYPMQSPFMILATQNPVDQEGTYRLPEAELDRFMMKVVLSYPSEEAETNLLRLNQEIPVTTRIENAPVLFSGGDLENLFGLFSSVRATEPVLNYIASITRKTRETKDLFLGVSPRAGLSLLTASRAEALLNGRFFVTPDDVKSMVVPVFRHRIILTAESELEGKTAESVISDLLNQVPIPR